MEFIVNNWVSPLAIEISFLAIAIKLEDDIEFGFRLWGFVNLHLVLVVLFLVMLKLSGLIDLALYLITTKGG